MDARLLSSGTLRQTLCFSEAASRTVNILSMPRIISAIRAGLRPNWTYLQKNMKHQERHTVNHEIFSVEYAQNESQNTRESHVRRERT